MFRVFRKIVLIAAATLTLVGMSQSVQAGEKTFGLHGGYISRNESADIGLFFQYSFTKHFRLQPAADLVFRHRDRDAFIFDLNAQFPIPLLTHEKFSLYPFAGLNFSSWNRHYDTSVSSDAWDNFNPEYSTRTNRFGANVGAGFDLKVSPTLKLNIEGGYTFIKSNSCVRALVGIGYVF